MLFSKRTAKIMVFAGVFCAALIYLVFADSLSETDMVRISYLWLPVSISGAAMLLSRNYMLKTALIWFLVALLGLFVFFELVFPML